MPHQPKTINTSDVTLPSELEALVERLAEHVHGVWAQQRIADGWALGPERDDRQKRHPCLVPYDQLAEEEKQYDRTTAAETLKAILALGYRIRSR